MNTRGRIASTTKLLQYNRDDWIFRIDGGQMLFISLPPGFEWIALVMASQGTSIHEMLGRGPHPTRLYFDIELEEGDPGWSAHQWDDHTLVIQFAEYLRNVYQTRVMVSCASKKTKISYHIWCLDFGGANVTSLKEACFWIMKEGPMPIYMFDRGVYQKNKTMRLTWSSKLGENRPLVILDEASDPYDREDHSVMFIQGPVDRIFRSKKKVHSIETTAMPENWRMAADIIEEQMTGLIASHTLTKFGTYRANCRSPWFCLVCKDEHTSDHGSFTPLETGVRFWCFGAARRDMPGYKAPRTVFIPYS